ncbi:1-aminocyclopropane-1-carboxylate oxidase 1-like [Panicum virgatum]|uniref:1-aminocyclopropane-1-carboxylate oxidase 1-like n=1 Tax=Panicum virgatum TaxID=38727 RepID=UPI0019D5A6B3|nr:1-aminocyclopropane-1-carboxylate oxidase 1-like [Panicum virgatum]
MEIPVIDLKGLAGDESSRSRTMAQIHEACKDWGFFWLENHGVDAAVMEDVKRFVLGHYEEHLEAKFHASHLAGNLDAAQVDWEAAYSIHHRPETNIADFTEISPATRELLDAYIAQTVALAELLAECMSLNLGLAAGHIRAALAPPAVGTKFAMYPACPRPELVWGLRAHTDAGGIVIMLQLRNTDTAGKSLQLLFPHILVTAELPFFHPCVSSPFFLFPTERLPERSWPEEVASVPARALSPARASTGVWARHR